MPTPIAMGLSVQEQKVPTQPETTSWESTPRNHRNDDHSHHSIAEIDEIDSFLRAANIGTIKDDPTEPVLTPRMFALGIFFCIVASGLNTLYTLRTPSITITASVVLLLAFPLGKLWEKTVPSWKEHVLIYTMSNLSVNVRLGADVLTEQQKFYGYSAGLGFQFVITLATFLIGFSLAGLCRAIVVVPRELIWPGVLSVTTMVATLHNIGEKDMQARYDTWKISRHAFFSLVFCVSFCWYWFPDFVFPALSHFNFACWIKPKSVVLNQLLGIKSGAGLIPITFDWSQVSYVASPLLVPSWAILNVAAGLVFWIWIVAVACYYSNTWNTSYLPFQSSKVYDNTGNVYNATRIVGAATGYKLDVQKYLNYSPVYMPVTFALNSFGLSFATLTALLVWVVIEHRKAMVTAAKRIPQLIRESLSCRGSSTDAASKASADEVPMWWYLVSSVVALALSILAVEYWHLELRWYGVLLACAVALIFYVPLALVYATANLKIKIDVLCRIIAGLVFEGKVLANIWFFDIGYMTTIKGLYFAQDMKLAYYCNIPQKSLFIAQCTGMLFGTLASILTLDWSLDNIRNICTKSAPNGFTCPYSTTHFNTTLIWGAIGPRRFFADNYKALLYFPILGALLGLPIYYLRRVNPSSQLWKKIHIPLFLGGLNYLPPATGMNYGSWVVVGLLFGWVVKRARTAWWGKYNFVLSAALDTSVSVAGVVIFFAIYFSGVSSRFSWWGTEVYKDTCDWNGCPYLQVPEGGKLGV
ncbi:OPT oligopeptide transporter protein-domain-containing protein [Aspergillus undulatus]|uniref:OPT oligopeptide transporter protein-domain-containing protein n=1 Tax=Aspergillus undulatus TaxID=1810928 RepID=UPI003CCCCB10